MTLTLQQPKALKILFLTEMWERFGFYTIQAMLIFYLMNSLSFSEADAYTTLGQFTALVFVTPAIGGWLCDNFLGNRFSVLLGAGILCLGYAFLALMPATVFLGLSLIAVGNGFLKPNISSFLGKFYGLRDARREVGFTLFYIGICLGITLATLSAGYIQQFIGWGGCFGAASFSLLMAAFIFRKGYRYFDNKGFPDNASARTLFSFLRQHLRFIAGLFLALFLIYELMLHPNFSNYIIYSFAVLFFLYIWLVSKKLEQTLCDKMRVLLIFFCAGIVFWSLFFEMFFVVNVFTESMVDREFFGYTLPASVFLGIETFFIIPFGFLFAYFWRSQKVRLSQSLKFSLGIFLVGFSMQVLAWLVPTTNMHLDGAWLILFYLILTLADLLISPIILSMITEYVPSNYSGLMMGGWFLSYGCSGKITGFLAQYAVVPTDITNLRVINDIYRHAFQLYAWIGFITFGVLFALLPIIRKKLGEDNRIPAIFKTTN